MHRLLALALPVAAAAQPGAPDVQSALNELFNNGQLAGMDVSARCLWRRGRLVPEGDHPDREQRVWPRDAVLHHDGHGDFREVELGAKASITLPDNIKRVLDLFNTLNNHCGR